MKEMEKGLPKHYVTFAQAGVENLINSHTEDKSKECLNFFKLTENVT